MIPEMFLPCIDDPDRLRVIGDWLEENGNPDLAKACRWTANEWKGNRGFRRCMVEEGMQVWARYACIGWSPGVIRRVTPRAIIVGFTSRNISPAGAMQSGQRAWWDLEPRGRWNGHDWTKPKKRNGYGATANAELAAMLCGARKSLVARPEPTGHQSAPRLIFEDMLLD